MSHLISQPIDALGLAASVTTSGRGAVVTFSGLVRDSHAGRQVVALGYTAYGPMAEKVCSEVLVEAERRWDVRAAVQHRLGELAVGDVAVVVVIAAAHRGAAFEACQWVIDEVKSRAPIWKREQYADGTEAWVDPTAPGGAVMRAS